MNSKILSLLFAILLAGWMAQPLAAQGVKPLAVDPVPDGTLEDVYVTVQAEELREKRMAAAALLNMVPLGGAFDDENRPENDFRFLAEQAASDEDPVVSYYGALALALSDGHPLPPQPIELFVANAPPVIPAGVSFTEPRDWETFLDLTFELSSESADERFRAINGLINLAFVTGPVPAPEVVFEIQAMLNDKNPQVAHMAARALNSLVPSDDRRPIDKALGRLSTEEELFALVDASIGEGGESAEQRLYAMEALLEAAMQTPLAEDYEVIRAFEMSAADSDARIADFAKLALHGGLDGDPDALAGTWVAPVDPYQQVEYSDQPPSPIDDGSVDQRVLEGDGAISDVYVNPEPQPFEPDLQPPAPKDPPPIATYVEVAPDVWVNINQLEPDPEMQQPPE